MNREITLPFLVQGTNTINEYLEFVRKDREERGPRTENQEQEIINLLAGLGGLIEYNVRSGYQHFARNNNLDQESYHNFGQLVDSLSQYLTDNNHKKLLKIASQIRNKLIHADFPALYKKTKEAYEIEGLGLYQDDFSPVVQMFTTTLTRYGCNLDVKTGKAVDSRGVEIPTRKLIPGEGGAITIDFSFFYTSGHFIHVYDVLFTCYKSIVFFRYDHA